MHTFLQSAPSFSLRFPGQSWRCKHDLLSYEWTQIGRIEKPTVRKPRPSSRQGAGRQARRQPVPLLHSLSFAFRLFPIPSWLDTQMCLWTRKGDHRRIWHGNGLFQGLRCSLSALLRCLLGCRAPPLLGSWTLLLEYYICSERTFHGRFYLSTCGDRSWDLTEFTEQNTWFFFLLSL